MNKVGGNQEKSIKTDLLEIEGNIMIWDDTMIQLSNVSCISTSSLQSEAFPGIAILLIVLGVVILRLQIAIAIALIAAGGIWIYRWYQANRRKKEQIILEIMMNSGTTFGILFNNRKFLSATLEVLTKIIRDGGIGEQYFTINVKGNVFEGDANVLNELNLR